MVLLMLSELIQRIQDLFKPYTIDDFMNDAKPVDHKDVQRLEKIWEAYQSNKLFNSCY
jgi:hypothetical protein